MSHLEIGHNTGFILSHKYHKIYHLEPHMEDGRGVFEILPTEFFSLQVKNFFALLFLSAPDVGVTTMLTLFLTPLLLYACHNVNCFP